MVRRHHGPNPTAKGVDTDTGAGPDPPRPSPAPDASLRLIADTIADVLWLAEPATGRVLYVNPAFEQVWGLPREQLYIDPSLWCGAVDPSDRPEVERRFSTIEHTGRFEADYRIHRRDGQVRWVRDRGWVLSATADRPAYLAGMARDVTQLKQLEHDAEAEHQRQHRAQQQAMASLESLLGVVAHELRTPLSAVRVMTELMLQSAREPDGEFDAMMRIHQEVVRMSELVHDMLETARQNGDGSTWQWSRFELGPVVEDCLRCVRPLLDPDRVSLDAYTEPADLAMHGDAASIRRLTINLLSNAAQHTPDGAIQLVIEQIEPTGDAAPMRQVRIVVHDTGCGIDPKHLPLLGRPFATNSARVGSGYSRGTGLGLAICCGIVAAHGGRIELSSQPGSGTSINIVLMADADGPQPGKVGIEVMREANAP